MKEYKVETIGIALKTKKGFNELFQNLLNERSSEGWKLHSFHFDAGSYCCVVFERDTEEA